MPNHPLYTPHILIFRTAFGILTLPSCVTLIHLLGYGHQMKLSVEVISQARHHLNPAKDRELSLRG